MTAVLLSYAFDHAYPVDGHDNAIRRLYEGK